VLVATGDNGVWNREPVEKFKFHPFFPGCVPHVTAVGATQLQSNGAETTGVAFSGGGFTPRAYFTRAASAPYQAAAVQGYLSSGVKLPNQTYWDNTGRGIPDVSAVGVNFMVYISGGVSGVSGTSASTPTVAGIIGLVNDKRMAAGQAPLGFLNPFLYQNPGVCCCMGVCFSVVSDCILFIILIQAFRDILLGENNGGDLLQAAFLATKGWDPVTGLGTPNYGALKAAALKAGEKTVGYKRRA
jgi:tripeptidyl-peptidase-1